MLPNTDHPRNNVCLLDFCTAQIVTSTTVSIVCISWVINVTNNNNDARWKPEITCTVFCIGPDDGTVSRNMSQNF